LQLVADIVASCALEALRGRSSRCSRAGVPLDEGVVAPGELARVLGRAATDAYLLHAGIVPHKDEEGVVAPGELARMLGRAAELALGRYSGLPTHAAQQGYVEWLVARVPAFSEPETLHGVGGIVLRVLLQLALAPASAQRLAAPAPPLVPALQAAISWDLGAAIFCLDILRCALHASNPDRDELCHQARLCPPSIVKVLRCRAVRSACSHRVCCSHRAELVRILPAAGESAVPP
jgi:hypothetical protein